MSHILMKALGFLAIIGLGYFLKIRRVVKREDAGIFSTIVMNVTLPCALLASASYIQLSAVLLVPLILGFVANLIMDAMGYFRGRKQGAVDKGVSLLQLSGYNIGTFSLPFVQAFFPASYLATVLLFDTGNAFMVLGGNYTLAASLNRQKNH
ncbi:MULTISPECIES: hypothetical protein [unclassified Streptococcus]|uniref:hypothetical protein n=1 Tax=unclassified Streptococcus TaxID=2608887 RepID=UPI000B2F02B8|nr:MULTISPECIES: hypothetical protein [unclassified Streptococcus]